MKEPKVVETIDGYEYRDGVATLWDCNKCSYRSVPAGKMPCKHCNWREHSAFLPLGGWDDYDQIAKADAGKPQLTIVPRRILYEIAKVRKYGTDKYGDPENWKKVEVERYRDAAFRHFMAYLDDPHGVDTESGLPHLSHLACNIAFLCEMEGAEKE